LFGKARFGPVSGLLDIDGSTDAFAAPGLPGTGSGSTQLILDISGYFAP